MTVEFAVESQYLNDQKNIIRERIIPWEGLARANIINEDEANYIKILEKQSADNKRSTIVNQLKLYSQILLNLLNKLDVNGRDDVIKNLMVLINDLLLDLSGSEANFSKQLLELNKLDESLPFEPLLKHLDNSDLIIKNLAVYNITILLLQGDKLGVNVSPETVSKVFSVLSSLINEKDLNFKFINIQLLQYLLINKTFKAIYLLKVSNFLENFKVVNSLISYSISNDNLQTSNLQLIYNTLLTIWILSFSPKFNRWSYHNFPELIGNLLIISKDLIKLKIIRLAVSILNNSITLVDSSTDKFKVIKIILYNDGLNLIDNLKDRKISSNGADDELTNDLNNLFDSLNDMVKNKLTSFDEYLTELENPNLISWSSPTHKSSEFWLENSSEFRANNFKLTKKMFSILQLADTHPNAVLIKVILLNDLQYLIQNLGNDLINFINNDKNNKLLIMTLLDNSSDNELKYQALKTIQLLVGHTY